jgi:hypothetical protein
MPFGKEKMKDAEIISKISQLIQAKKSFWINGDYLREGEAVHWECFVKVLGSIVAVGFDEYLEKYEDAVDLYDVYVRKQFTNIEEALTFILNSLPLAAERLRSS